MVQHTESNLRYMDWNPYLHSVNDDLNVINALIPFCYDLGKGNVKKLAINLQGLYYSRGTYIMDEKILIKIEKVIQQFHIPSFVKDYSEKTPNALNYEYVSIKVLLKCYNEIVLKLSRNKLIPEVEYVEIQELDDLYKGVAL
ncbi:MAG: hypothetical protein MJK08_14595 [Campylobacterales bacterium]|nr:hypothetical protein [Campylobacterales bacterium]